MAQQYLTNINLGGNEIQNFVIQPLAAPPTSSLGIGRKYYNSAEKREAVYDGTNWNLSVYKTEFDTLAGNVATINARLVSIESFFRDESQTDNLINKWNEIVDFLNGIGDTTLEGILEGFAKSDLQIIAGEGLVGGGSLTEDVTLSLATSGVTEGTYTKVSVDEYGRVISAANITANDIPYLPITKIAGLQEELNNRHTKEEIANLLAKYVLLEAENQTIKGNIRIEGNLVVTGESASCGQGGGGTVIGGITGITVNGETYYAENGIVTIPNYPTSLEWDKISGKPSLTKKYASTITKSTATSYTINHALNTMDVVVMVYDPSNEQVMVDVTVRDANNIVLGFAVAPSQNYKVVVVG